MATKLIRIHSQRLSSDDDDLFLRSLKGQRLRFRVQKQHILQTLGEIRRRLSTHHGRSGECGLQRNTGLGLRG